VGIIGGKGLLGSDLVEHLGKDFESISIDKDNYETHRGASFDVLVNANGNSRRFWANDNPREDFSASTISVYNSTTDFHFKKYVYISSSDVYENHEESDATKENVLIRPEGLSPYGLHKYLAEQVVRNRTDNFLILRSSMILGANLKKGPFYDILHGSPLFITADSRLQAISTSVIADVIRHLITSDRRNEVFNMGGQETFNFQDLSTFVSLPVSFRQDAERQIYEMNVDKLKSIYPLKTSTEYVGEFLSHYVTEKTHQEN